MTEEEQREYDVLKKQLKEELEPARAAVVKKLLPDPSNESYLHSRRLILIEITDIKRKMEALQRSNETKPAINSYRIPLKLR